MDEVIRRKYLMDGDDCCGFVSGIMFANRIGLTTQVPGVYEICTNKATTDYRETHGNSPYSESTLVHSSDIFWV